MAAAGDGVMIRYDDETWAEAVALPGAAVCWRRAAAGTSIVEVAPRILKPESCA